MRGPDAAARCRHTKKCLAERKAERGKELEIDDVSHSTTAAACTTGSAGPVHHVLQLYPGESIDPDWRPFYEGLPGLKIALEDDPSPNGALGPEHFDRDTLAWAIGHARHLILWPGQADPKVCDEIIRLAADGECTCIAMIRPSFINAWRAVFRRHKRHDARIHLVAPAGIVRAASSKGGR